MKAVFLAVLLIPLSLLYSQVPDTIVVKTARVKGFGPFLSGTRTHLVTMDTSTNDPWPRTIPAVKGLPPDHSTMLFRILDTDFYQYLYQNYYQGNIPEVDYKEMKKQFDWEPSPSELTRQTVREGIAVLACVDSLGNTKVKIDRNNNYDLGDDEWFALPPILPGQSVQGRYNDLLAFEVAYQLYDGHQIRTYKSWLYVDFWSNPKGKRVKGNQLELAYAFAEHHAGGFSFNQRNYTLALYGSNAAIRHDYFIKVWETDNDSTMPKGYGVKEGELVQLGEYYYKVSKATIDGGEVTLTKFGYVSSTGGSQVGLKAPLFSAKSITGENIDLAYFKGKYVMLDFWGSWCVPCQQQIPELRVLYQKYAGRNFALIGIAKDKVEALDSYVKENGVTWPQILQDSDHHILRLYDIGGYPTTFLIDPDGKIVAKGLQPDALEATLNAALSR